MIHAKDEELKKLLKGELPVSKSEEILDHIAVCDLCSQKLADYTLDMATLDPPEGMYEEVLNAAAKEKSDRRKKGEILFLYSMRVITGVCAAIVLMYTGMFDRFVNFNIDMNKVNDASHSISEHLHDNLNKFSDTLFKMEVKAG